MATLSWVCMAIMFVMESNLAKQELKLKLIKKIVHLSVSELMSNSDRMVLLHLNIKSFALISIAS